MLFNTLGIAKTKHMCRVSITSNQAHPIFNNVQIILEVMTILYSLIVKY